jgi:CRISPR-associated protein Cas2
MRGVADYAIVYDIACDKERARVDKTLKGFGFRAQKSVFECRLNRKGKIELIAMLEAQNIQTGFIKIYRLEYASKKQIIGNKEGDDFDSGAAFII